MNRVRRAEAGFNLIEMTLAAFVFTIGALGLLSLTYGSIEGLSGASNVTYAAILASNKMDELLVEPFDSSNLTDGVHNDGSKNLGPHGTPFTPEGAATGNFGDADGWFYRSWTVATPSTGFKTIVVDVKWTKPGQSNEHRVTMAAGRSEQ